MPPALAPSGWHRTFAVLGTFTLLVFALWAAKPVFMVLALATLLAFALQPIASRLQRAGFRRLVSVLLTAIVAFSLLAGLGWLFTSQIRGIMADWPRYRQEIEVKVQQIDPWGHEQFLLNRFRELGQVVFDYALPAAVAFMENLVTVVFVTILVIFMLLRHEDLRNRFIRLLGREHRTVLTTRALDEAATRIGRFLLMQALINASFGLILGISVFFIGLPYAPLWGFLAALVRFIPYIGTWVGLLLPAVFSLATASSWVQPLEVIGIFVILELLTANLAEPLLFGLSAGVSPVALLVAAVFWGWLWGPIGLILSTPMTVCLYVLGKYVPQLEFFEILLGDEAALDPSVNYYQRLLARDQDEATDVIEEEMHSHTVEQVFDRVLAPALVLAKRDAERGDLEEEDRAYILNVTQDLVTDWGFFESLVSKPVPAADGRSVPLARESKPRAPVVGCAAADDFDAIAVTMFRQLVEPAGADVEALSAKSLSSDVIAAIEKRDPALVFIASLAPGGLSQTRYLCKRLHGRFPELKILVGRWEVRENSEQVKGRLLEAGASMVAFSLSQSAQQALPLIQAWAHVRPPRGNPSSEAPSAVSAAAS